MAIRVDEPLKPSDKSSTIEKEYYAKWERSNTLIIIATKRNITEHLLSSLLESTDARNFLDIIW